MKKMIVVIMALLLWYGNGFCFDQTFYVDIDGLEDLAVKADGVKVNNFSIEETAESYVSTNVVRIGVSIRNKNEKRQALAIMVAGQDDQKNNLWATNIAMGGLMAQEIAPNRTETATGYAVVPPGTLKETKGFWVRVVIP